MFLRRDFERKITLHDYPDLGDRQKRTLLDDFAYWLIKNSWGTGRHGDGYFGWAEAAPFDCIMITAAVDHIPPPLLKQLKNIRTGCIRLIDAGESFQFGETYSDSTLSATIEVTDSSFYGDIAFGGSIGAGEAYMRGAWQCATVNIILDQFLDTFNVR